MNRLDPAARAADPRSGVTVWLEALGLSQYSGAFDNADIDLEVLPHLTDGDLRELGVQSLGHRRKILANLPGARKPGNTTNPGAELRHLTIVFCDLVGSTQLAAALGDEAFADLLDRVYATVDRAAEAFGGQVAQFHGDGALAYFGYPEAHEDAAERAVLAACRMVEAVASLPLPSDPGLRLAARAGVASGLVVVDARPGLGPDRSGRAFGSTVNLAARLQSIADTGTVVLADATARLVQDHLDCVPLGLKQLKGLDAPVALYQVRCPKAVDPGTVVRARPARVPLSGRTAERALIAQQWQIAQDGGFSHVTVLGEPGIGKTRLVSDCLSSLESQGHPVQRLACHPRAGDIPYFPFLVALRRERTAGVKGAAEVLALLETSAGGGWQDRRQHREATIAALAAHFAGDGTASALWLEDMQWADPSTIETVTALAISRPARLMLVCTSRTPSTASAESVQIALGRLQAEETRPIVEALLDETSLRVDPSLIDALVDRAEGVPIFAEELALDFRTRLATDSQSLQGNAAALIPSSLVQLLQARIGRLTVARPLMRTIATLDRSIPISVLRDLWAGPGRLEAALDELVATGLAELAIGQGEEENRLNIRHQLIADCAYDMILKRDRPPLHSANADALAARQARGIPVVPRLRADQLERAGRLREAAEFWKQAGRAAAAQSADAEAAGLFRRALDLVPNLGADDLDWSRQFEADTLLALYPTLIGAFGYLPAGHELSVRLPAVIAGVGGADRLLAALFMQWIDRTVQGDIDGAHELVVGLSTAVLSGQSDLHALVIHRLVGSTHMFRGEFPEARFHLRAFIDAYRPAEHAEPLRAFGATDNLTTVLCCLAAIEAIVGTTAATDRAIADALASATATGHPHTLCHTLAFGAGLPAAIRSDWSALARHVQQLADIVATHQLGFWGHFAAILEGILLTSGGNIQAGQVRFDEGHGALIERGMRFMGPSFRFCLARASGQSVDPLILARLAEDLAKGERWLLPSLQTLAADISYPIKQGVDTLDHDPAPTAFNNPFGGQPCDHAADSLAVGAHKGRDFIVRRG
jgi:class 3 adenylate cyclase